jgi:hypothetical protein
MPASTGAGRTSRRRGVRLWGRMPFHVSLSEGLFQSATLYNLDAGSVARICGPLLRGQAIVVREHEWKPGDTKVVVMEGPALEPGQFTMGHSWRNASRRSKDVSADWMDPQRSPAIAMLEPPPAPPAPLAPPSRDPTPVADPRRIAVLGGHDPHVAQALGEWLGDQRLTVLDRLALAEATGAVTPGPVDLVEHALALTAVLVIVLGPQTPPSPGVLVEAGAALALAPQRTVVVAAGALAVDPDLVSLGPVRLDPSPAALGELSRRLRLAGAALPPASGPLDPGPLAAI